MDSCLAWLPLLAEKDLNYAFLCAAILLVTIPMLLRIYRYQARQKRRGPVRPSARQAKRDPRGLRAGAPDSIVLWEVEMQELARDLKAEIDSKMVALEQLIRDADRAANRLERAAAVTDDPDIVAVAETPDVMPPVESNSLENAGLRDQVYALADYGYSVADIASRLATQAGQVELILRLRGERK